MPLIVDPSKANTNGVGRTFRIVNITLAIVLPSSVLFAALIWGYKNGFNCFF